MRQPAPGEEHRAPTVLSDGTVLRGGYRVTYLATGGMSVAYRAERGEDAFFVKEAPASEPQKVIALTQERATLDRLDHPAIVKVFDLFEQDGHYYLVLEFVDGQTLEDLLPSVPDQWLPQAQVIDWALQLCAILEYLHSQDPPVIYRDLKPRNVVRDPEGTLHLVDFGIARTFKDRRHCDTHPMGSALFASPEHYGGTQTDARSDIYTLGATLHYLLSGGRHVGQEAFSFVPLREVRPDVSSQMERIVARAVEVQPARRFSSVADIRAALERCRAGVEDEAAAASAAPAAMEPRNAPGEDNGGWTARERVVVAVTVGLVAMVLPWSLWLARGEAVQPGPLPRPVSRAAVSPPATSPSAAEDVEPAVGEATPAAIPGVAPQPSPVVPETPRPSPAIAVHETPRPSRAVVVPETPRPSPAVVVPETPRPRATPSRAPHPRATPAPVARPSAGPLRPPEPWIEAPPERPRTPGIPGPHPGEGPRGGPQLPPWHPDDPPSGRRLPDGRAPGGPSDRRPVEPPPDGSRAPSSPPFRQGPPFERPPLRPPFERPPDGPDGP